MMLTVVVVAEPVVAEPPDAQIVQVTVGGYHTCGLGSDGTAYCWGQGSYGQLGNGNTADQLTPVAVDAPPGVTFTQLTAGTNHSCGLGSDSKGYCWGQGGDGQLGIGGGPTSQGSPVVKRPAAVRRVVRCVAVRTIAPVRRRSGTISVLAIAGCQRLRRRLR
ncbi:hypothetical protein Ari01nite_81190 [Paractinoplanes rishiriensis]|uniref:Uncharacterized protein n=1 Tax=Paractinoplanes rishiriensis TaxID=1050105 RepID=A0A919K8J7_9ACTN|nr:hypothetical protein Ari01nite_81190 [Actinoplanes rishiriensis]